MVIHASALWFTTWLACGLDSAPTTQIDEPDQTSNDTEVALEEMDPIDLLTRVSLDLRGVRPSIAEIEAVEADPEALEASINAFLYDDAFPEQVRNLFSQVFLTRQDYFYVTAAMYGLDDEALYAASVGEEPLQILGHIAAEDLPYTDIVTADWSMANEILGEIWPVDYPEGATGWQPVTYTDGRPMAGILSSNAMWWRFMTTTSNSNRGRANALSKALMCSDYLSKPIDFSRDVNLLDGDSVADALENNPGCVACHYSLDPLAAYLWGFYYIDYDSRLDTTYYHPEREHLWQDYTGVAPGYFGEPGDSLTDLGSQMASDPRIVECAVQHAFELLMQREAALDDTNSLTKHREYFLANELTIRALFRTVIDSEEYRAGGVDAPQAATRKMVSPDVLASQIEALTGFRFVFQNYDMMQTDTYGLRTLAGGFDGSFVTRPAEEPITTLILVQERLAQAAAAYVVESDINIDNRDERLIFTEVNLHELPAANQEPIVKQIQKLHLQLFGKRVSENSEAVQANLELWQDIYEAELDPEAAWAGLLAVLLRDPDFLFY